MEDFAYIKKYKPILNFILELLVTVILCFIMFAFSLAVFKGSKSFFVAFCIIDGIITLLCFISALFYAIRCLKKQIKFNKKNPNKCTIKLDELNNTLLLTNKKIKVSFDDILEFDYIKVCQREFFEGHSSLANDKAIKKSIDKRRIGNLRLKLKNEEIIVVERVLDIENISKKLKLILKTK